MALTIGAAEYPPEVAAYATMQPSIGLRPTARKASPPSGIMIMYEASEAIDEAVPARATMKVIHLGEAPAMVPRSIAGMSPDCSATATPRRTMMTRPSGGKVTKFITAPPTISRRDSVVKRFVTVTVSPVAGLTAFSPVAEKIAERIMTMTASERKSQNGCGSLLPAFSMTTRTFISQLRRSGLPAAFPVSAVVVDMGCSSVGRRCSARVRTVGYRDRRPVGHVIAVTEKDTSPPTASVVPTGSRMAGGRG